MSEEIPEPWPDAGKSLQERRAFTKFFEKYSDWVYNIALRISRDKQFANDIVSIVFHKYFKAQYDYNEIVKPLLYRMVINVTLDYLRSKPPVIFNEKTLAQEVAPGSNPEDIAEYKIIFDSIAKVVDKLPEKGGKVFKLVLQGKSNEEIAAELGMNDSTVRSHKANSIKAIKKLLPGIDFTQFGS